MKQSWIGISIGQISVSNGRPAQENVFEVEGGNLRVRRANQRGVNGLLVSSSQRALTGDESSCIRKAWSRSAREAAAFLPKRYRLDGSFRKGSLAKQSVMLR